MPTSLKIAIVFNFMAVVILCSVASMAEPTKISSDSAAQTQVSSTETSALIANEHARDHIVTANSWQVEVDQIDTQSEQQNNEPAPAPWFIRSDGSVQWKDAP